MRLLTRSDMQRALSMPDAIAAVREGFRQLSAGRAIVPPRPSVAVERHHGSLLMMPGFLPESSALGVKVLTLFDDNPKRKLPFIHGLMLTFDAETGQPTALMDAGYLTALRTGAASGLATDMLARADARTAAIFGAGAQARTQLLAVCAVRQIERAWIYDAVPVQLERFIAEMRAKVSAELMPAANPVQAVAEADVICTATTSATPVFAGTDVKPGTHVNSVGSYHPDHREVDSEFVRRAAGIVVDSRDMALSEAGDLIIPIQEGVITRDDIYAEIGELVASERPARESADEITFFKAVGLAVQDLAVAQAMEQSAEKLGLGIEVNMSY